MGTIADVVDGEGPRLDPSAPEPAAPASESRGRMAAVTRRFAPVLGLYGLVKLVGFAFFMLLLQHSGDYKHRDIGFGGGHSPWEVLGTFDGRYYQQLAMHWYHPQVLPAHAVLADVHPNSAAFFPLYPGLMGLVAKVTGIGGFGAGIVVSVVASFVAAAGIYSVVSLMGGQRAGVVAGALWALIPGSGVEWAVYSDSLFVAFAAWACYHTMKRQWIAAGVLAFVAGFNRPTAAALIAGVGLAALIALFKRQDGVIKPLFAILVSPWGFVGYIVWVGMKMHNLGGYFMIQKSWAHYFDWGRFTLHASGEIMIGRYHYLWPAPVADTVALITLLAVLCLLVLLVRFKPPVVLVVFTLLTIASTTTSQQIYSNIPRYLLPAFPLLIPLAFLGRKVRWPVLLPVLLIAGAASGWFAGYVTFEMGTP